MPNLQQLIDHTPSENVTIAVEKQPGHFSEQTKVTLPLSDHNKMFIKIPKGTFGVWNILNPESPVSPGIKSNDSYDMFRMNSDQDRKNHLFNVAIDIVKSLKADEVDGFALQEVPDKESEYFEIFCTALKLRSISEGVEIDMDTFRNSYHFTYDSDETSLGIKGFGTALIIKKKGRFTFQSMSPSLKSKDKLGYRGSYYVLQNLNTGELLTINNLHGEYQGSDAALVEYLIEEAQKPNMIVCGDMNIPVSNEKALALIKITSGLFVEPNTNKPDTLNGSRTLDCILSSIEKSEYFGHSTQKNYAEASSLDVESTQTPPKGFFKPVEATPMSSTPKITIEDIDELEKSVLPHPN